MSDYINRYAVLNAINDAIANNALSYESCINEIMESIAKIPTADVAPVRHGHWIGTEYDGYADGNPVYTLFECSECGVEYEQEEHYCPWCGARMDGEESV